MVKRFTSYGALDAFILGNALTLIKCWPEINGDWIAEFRA